MSDNEMPHDAIMGFFGKVLNPSLDTLTRKEKESMENEFHHIFARVTDMYLTRYERNVNVENPCRHPEVVAAEIAALSQHIFMTFLDRVDANKGEILKRSIKAVVDEQMGFQEPHNPLDDEPRKRSREAE